MSAISPSYYIATIERNSVLDILCPGRLTGIRLVCLNSPDALLESGSPCEAVGRHEEHANAAPPFHDHDDEFVSPLANDFLPLRESSEWQGWAESEHDGDAGLLVFVSGWFLQFVHFWSFLSGRFMGGLTSKPRFCVS
jgi:hypothetical protein